MRPVITAVLALFLAIVISCGNAAEDQLIVTRAGDFGAESNFINQFVEAEWEQG